MSNYASILKFKCDNYVYNVIHYAAALYFQLLYRDCVMVCSFISFITG